MLVENHHHHLRHHHMIQKFEVLHLKVLLLKVGQVIKARVVDFNGEDRKISLSMKALEAPVEEEAVEE